MLNSPNRATQFQAFDALSGYRDALKEVEKLVESGQTFNIKDNDIIDKKIKKLVIGKHILVKYYYNGECLNTCGLVSKIDKPKDYLLLEHTIISFADIMDIENID